MSPCDASDTRLQGAPSLRLSRSSVDAEAPGSRSKWTARSHHYQVGPHLIRDDPHLGEESDLLELELERERGIAHRADRVESVEAFYLRIGIRSFEERPISLRDVEGSADEGRRIRQLYMGALARWLDTAPAEGLFKRTRVACDSLSQNVA
jgi:hypothetical protein